VKVSPYKGTVWGEGKKKGGKNRGGVTKGSGDCKERGGRQQKGKKEPVKVGLWVQKKCAEDLVSLTWCGEREGGVGKKCG